MSKHALLLATCRTPLRFRMLYGYKISQQGMVGGKSNRRLVSLVGKSTVQEVRVEFPD